MFCALRLGLHPRLGEKSDSLNFGRKIGPNLSEDLFFYFRSSPNFGRKIGLILGGTISDSDFALLKFSEVSAHPPFQNPAYATD